MSQHVYQHYRVEERAFVDQVLDWIMQVEQQYAPKLTDFLDPRQLAIAKELLGNRSDISLYSHGGYQGAERQRLLFAPDYMVPETDDYGIVCFEIVYPVKFVTLEHSNVLGAAMNVGLDRVKFGDIVSNPPRYQLIVAEEVASFVQRELTSVGKATIKLKEKPPHEVIIPAEEGQPQQLIVASLRLDAVLAQGFRLSRAKASALIQAGKVKVNFQIIDAGSFEVQPSDVLSLRGYGRLFISSIEGQTRRAKFRLSTFVKKS
ncbi:RNA-binding protein [Bacillaceae bacterium SIJ1]|uniref:YlmH family RNA-binding protein n=1 Tax=Litoribacterium kuwaitense TaxID=1398745 RepID=UPI0013EDBE10|nr:RNA-binding protein [Litoribacterium kuwaitense]NGP44326.1 RNA-binding protein [Litoribacterium kuwaitense]